MSFEIFVALCFLVPLILLVVLCIKKTETKKNDAYTVCKEVGQSSEDAECPDYVNVLEDQLSIETNPSQACSSTLSASQKCYTESSITQSGGYQEFIPLNPTGSPDHGHQNWTTYLTNPLEVHSSGQLTGIQMIVLTNPEFSAQSFVHYQQQQAFSLTKPILCPPQPQTLPHAGSLIEGTVAHPSMLHRQMSDTQCYLPYNYRQRYRRFSEEGTTGSRKIVPPYQTVHCQETNILKEGDSNDDYIKMNTASLRSNEKWNFQQLLSRISTPESCSTTNNSDDSEGDENIEFTNVDLMKIKQYNNYKEQHDYINMKLLPFRSESQDLEVYTYNNLNDKLPSVIQEGKNSDNSCNIYSITESNAENVHVDVNEVPLKTSHSYMNVSTFLQGTITTTTDKHGANIESESMHSLTLHETDCCSLSSDYIQISRIKQRSRELSVGPSSGDIQINNNNNSNTKPLDSISNVSTGPVDGSGTVESNETSTVTTAYHYTLV